MSKTKVIYQCQTCGHRAAKWLGRCPNCETWNSFVEEIQTEPSATPQKRVSIGQTREAGKACRLDAIDPTESNYRLQSGVSEFDRVLGGGILPGSLILIGGEPGIGKSTLLLQIIHRLSVPVLYTSGEESVRQIKVRADRCGLQSNNVLVSSETNLESIVRLVKKHSPEVLVIDSIQTLFNPLVGTSPGSIGQVRESTASLLALAKQRGCSVFIVGHVTKEGSIAGPRTLEHIVDTVLYFEGDMHYACRILRAVKNRFGSTDEIGLFEMSAQGLSEIANPARYFIDGRLEHHPGSVVTVTREGSRPLMVEIQALTTTSGSAVPRRIAEGTDTGKVMMIAAILEKTIGLNLRQEEVYVKIAAGIRMNEPSIDLAIATAIVSSFRTTPVRADVVVIGELSLSGTIRPVTGLAVRIAEAEKLGFKRICIPANSDFSYDSAGQIEIIQVKSVVETFEHIME